MAPVYVLISLAVFIAPGLLLSVAARSEKNQVLGLTALAFTGSIAALSLSGFVLIRLGLYSSTATWLLAVLVTGGAGIMTVTGRYRHSPIRLPALWEFSLLLPSIALGIIRWMTYEAGSRFPRGWDSGINAAFLADLQRSGALPVTQLGEPVNAYYYQGIFPVMDVLHRPQLIPFAEVKIFSVVAVVALILAATWLVVTVLGANRGTLVGSGVAAVVFGAFFVTSAHAAMMTGLAIGFALVALGLEVARGDRQRTSGLVVAALLGFALVAIHPTSIQILGLGVVGLTVGLLLDEPRRSRMALVPISVFAGSVLAGALLHGALAPGLTRAEVAYSISQSSAIDSGGLQVNAAVAAGAVRGSIRDLFIWLVPPLAAPFVVFGLGSALVRSRLAVLGLGAGLAAAAFVKVSPTNGRDYLILFVPLMLVFAVSVGRLVDLSGRREARVGLMAVLTIVGSAALMRADRIGSSPAVGRVAYVDDATIIEAGWIGAEAGADAVLAVRYRPETLLVQGSTGVLVIGGYSGLGSAASFSDMDDLIDGGPGSGQGRVIACRYGITHVYVLRSDPAYGRWIEDPGAIATPEGLLIPLRACRGDSG